MITVEKSEKNTLKLNVKISNEVWQKALEIAYETTKGKFNIQGFRKGKAPRKVIEKTYGDTVFYDEAFDSLISKEYADFMANNKEYEPIEHPHVTINSITENGVDASVLVLLMPEVELGKYEGLKFEKKIENVTESDIDEEVKKLASTNARYVESNEEACLGDFATIDFSGSVDGVKFDGGTASDYRLELGSHSFIDNFEDQIVGMKVGDERAIKVTFPKEYPAKELAGKESVFDVKLKKLEKKEIPEINDKFISDTTEFENLEEYKNSVKEKLLKDAEAKAERVLEDKIVKTIVDSSKVEIPQSMIDHEIMHIIEDLRKRLSYQQITLEQYLEFMKVSLDEFKEARKEEAKNSLKTRLVLQTLIKNNKLSVSKEEYFKRIEEFALRSGKTVEEFDKEISDYERAYIENDVLMTKLFNMLKEKNQIK